MSRALVLGSLVPAPLDDSERRRIFRAIEGCSLFKDSGVPARVEPLRDLIRSSFPNEPPAVLDCFAGGGAIPLEALRLGGDVTAVDLNPVAYLIERCMLEFPQRFGSDDERGKNSLAEDVRRWGETVAHKAAARLSPAFPHSGVPSVLWSYVFRLGRPR